MNKIIEIKWSDCGACCSEKIKIHTKEQIQLLYLLEDIGAIDFIEVEKEVYDTNDYNEDI